MSDVKVKFAAEDDGLLSTLKRVEAQLKGTEDQADQTNKKVSIGFASMAKAAAGFAVGLGVLKLGFSSITGTVAAFGDALDMGGRLNDLAARTGESAGKVLLLERAFANAGSSAEKVGPTINKLQKFIDDASDSGSEQAKTMARLGLTYENLKAQSPVEQLRSTAEAIASVQDDGTRAALAMKVFGKNGGELLPFLRDFGNGLSGAKEELGRMVGIMDAKSAVFDTVSDKIAIVKGKLTEFAAGILSQTVPALELLFTNLARIDAAAIGENFAKAFVGGQAAMEGFSAALAAMKIGEFRLSFEIAWASIQLQAAQSANAIYANLRAAFASAAEFLTVALGPGSGVWTILSGSFELLGQKLSHSISNAIYNIIKDVGLIPSSIREGMAENIKLMEKEMDNTSNKMKNSLAQVPGDFILAADEAKKAFGESIKSAKTLVETTGLKVGLDEKILELTKKQTAAASEAAASALANLQKQQDFSEYDLKAGGKRTDNLGRIKELEVQIATAKAMGNEALTKDLEAQKVYYEQLERSIASGKTEQEALAEAGKAYAHSLSSANKEAAKVTTELKEQLSLSQKISQEISDFKSRDQIDPGGKLEKRAKDALNRGDTQEAERINKRLGRKEEDSDLKDQFGGGKKFGKSLKDMAKDQGINTFRKSDKELRDELNKKLGNDLNKPGDDKRENNRRGAQDPGGAKDPMAAITAAVQEIQKLVAKIEPKLPTMALAQ